MKKFFNVESVGLVRCGSRGIQTRIYWFERPNYVPNLMKNWRKKQQQFNQTFNAVVSERSKTNI